jgi:hypothetical protein
MPAEKDGLSPSSSASSSSVVRYEGEENLIPDQEKGALFPDKD